MRIVTDPVVDLLMFLLVQFVVPHIWRYVQIGAMSAARSSWYVLCKMIGPVDARKLKETLTTLVSVYTSI
jgi:hypothetical protein